MSFTVACPHCSRVLSVTEKAYGKTLPCPGCQRPMTVPSGPPESQPAASPAGGRNGAYSVSLPSDMPPVPDGNGQSAAPGDGAGRAPGDPAGFPAARGVRRGWQRLGQRRAGGLDHVREALCRRVDRLLLRCKLPC